MKRFENIWKAAGLMALAVVLTGCPPKKKPVIPSEAEVTPPPQEEVKAPEETPQTGLEIGTDWASVPNMEAIYFDYNKADLRGDARAALKRNAEFLKTVISVSPAVQVRVEGHCDERGTLEYNLALGERRANAVRDYYASLGVSRSTLASISYGEERPVCAESSEDCWSRNRRGETTLKSAEGPIRIPLDKLSSTPNP
ncbi:MAG: peptidoglycan-associated lipoprotein Pal [Elusimicrobia bacterium]|nr:peptidoglycan-associated lipoprotein Pal [Elusimicrobiota bacterium]